MKTTLAASLLHPANADLRSCGRRAFSAHTWDVWRSFFICADLQKHHWSLLWILHRFSTDFWLEVVESSPRLGFKLCPPSDPGGQNITAHLSNQARWRLGVKAEVRGAAQRNAPRSACLIINGCQRLFSGRRCWQTALQKHWDCVNAPLWGGWGSWGCSRNVSGRWSRSPNLGSHPHLLPFEEFLDICTSCENVWTHLSTPAVTDTDGGDKLNLPTLLESFYHHWNLVTT